MFFLFNMFIFFIFLIFFVFFFFFIQILINFGYFWVLWGPPLVWPLSLLNGDFFNKNLTKILGLSFWKICSPKMSKTCILAFVIIVNHFYIFLYIFIYFYLFLYIFMHFFHF